MSLRIVKMPKFIQWLFPERIWAFSSETNKVFLTFDDGPIPEVTPWVLDELKKHGAKATFFCIGANVEKHSQIFQRIYSEGHTVGTHTNDHLNGWKTSTSEYIENVEKAIGKMDKPHPKLFRPPYGRITSKQAKILQKKGLRIVMWNIISYDYEQDISPDECLQNVLRKIAPGSIVVFHDSLKAEKNLRYALPKVLDYISERGWKPSAIANS